MVKNAIKVYARLKPEKSRKRVVKYQIHRRPEGHSDEDFLIFSVPQRVYEQIDNRPESWTFSFHRIFEESANQADVFEDVARPVAESVLDGYNGTIFAYGQTGSGKTYTITGEQKSKDNCGIISRTLQYIFQVIRKRPENVYSVEVAYLEIYNENGYDLLDRKQRSLFAVTRLEDLPRVTIQEDESGKLHLKNLTFHRVAQEYDAFELLTIGDANRVTAETPMNPHSSRSHCIFTVAISAKQFGVERYKRAKLHLVDLAGSERVYKCAITGTILTEAKHINLSLHYLEQVIVSLGQENAGHIPYRNSLLTAILRDSLGGNCLTTMLATLSVSTFNLEETMSTCRFAQRVALIKNDVNLILEKDTQSENTLLKLENERLRQQIMELTKQDVPFITPGENVRDKGTEYYKALVLQRDQEISLLIDMMKKEKGKVRMANVADEKSVATKEQVSIEFLNHTKLTRNEQDSRLENVKNNFSKINNKIRQLNETTIHKNACLNDTISSSLKTHNLTVHKLPNVDYQPVKNLELRSKAVQTKKRVINRKKENHYDTDNQEINVSGAAKLLPEDTSIIKGGNDIQGSMHDEFIDNNCNTRCKVKSTADFVKEHCGMYDDSRNYQEFLQSDKPVENFSLSSPTVKKLLEIVHSKSPAHDKLIMSSTNHEQLKPIEDAEWQEYSDENRESSEMSIEDKCNGVSHESSLHLFDNLENILKKQTRMYQKHINNLQREEHNVSATNRVEQKASTLTSEKYINNEHCSTIVNSSFKPIEEVQDHLVPENFQKKKKSSTCSASNTEPILNCSKETFGNSFDLLHNPSARKSLTKDIYKIYNKYSDSRNEQQLGLPAKTAERERVKDQLAVESSSVEKLKTVNNEQLISSKQWSDHLSEGMGSNRSHFDIVELCNNQKHTTSNADNSVYQNTKAVMEQASVKQGKCTDTSNKEQLYLPPQSINDKEVNYTLTSPQTRYSKESLRISDDELTMIKKIDLDRGTPRGFFKESKNPFNAQTGIKIHDSGEEKSLPLTGDPEIDEEIIAFYKAKRTGSEY